MVLSDKDFVKHYYAGAERVCTNQPIQYLPLGEIYVSKHAPSPYTERFTFTGKERDLETGYTYHGARYYDANLNNHPNGNPAPSGKETYRMIK